MLQQGLTYGLKYKARALDPQKGHSEASRFFVATCSLVEPNQLHLVGMAGGKGRKQATVKQCD
jgi:hypothetical protein